MLQFAPALGSGLGDSVGFEHERPSRQTVMLVLLPWEIRQQHRVMLRRLRLDTMLVQQDMMAHLPKEELPVLLEQEVLLLWEEQ